MSEVRSPLVRMELMMELDLISRGLSGLNGTDKIQREQELKKLIWPPRTLESDHAINPMTHVSRRGQFRTPVPKEAIQKENIQQRNQRQVEAAARDLGGHAS